MSYKIIENFLPEKNFNKIFNLLMNSEISWFYRDKIIGDDSFFYFTHSFYNNNIINSVHFEIIKPLLEKLNYVSLIEVRANMVFKKEKNILTNFHTDFDYKNFKTAIFYINENNGLTIIKDNDRIEIIPKQNKVLIMDGNVKHALVTQTDEKRRVIINVNYFEK